MAGRKDGLKISSRIDKITTSIYFASGIGLDLSTLNNLVHLIFTESFISLFLFKLGMYSWIKLGSSRTS